MGMKGGRKEGREGRGRKEGIFMEAAGLARLSGPPGGTPAEITGSNPGSGSTLGSPPTCPPNGGTQRASHWIPGPPEPARGSSRSTLSSI